MQHKKGIPFWKNVLTALGANKFALEMVRNTVENESAENSLVLNVNIGWS